MFLDTSGLFCLFDIREAHHALAGELLGRAGRRFTTSYVLVEFVSLVIARRANLEDGLEFIERLQFDDSIELIWVSEELHVAAMNLLHRRRDKTYSLCDAVSFVLMKEREITEALTTDHHFEQEGFTRLLK